MEKKHFRSIETLESVEKWPWLKGVSVRDGVEIPKDVYKFTRQAVQGYSAGELAEIGLEQYTPSVIETAVPEPSNDPRDYTLTRRQLRLGLLDLGVTDENIIALINDISDPKERARALIEWQDAQKYDFEHPLVVSLIAGIGLSANQASAAWLAARDL